MTDGEQKLLCRSPSLSPTSSSTSTTPRSTSASSPSTPGWRTALPIRDLLSDSRQCDMCLDWASRYMWVDSVPTSIGGMRLGSLRSCIPRNSRSLLSSRHPRLTSQYRLQVILMSREVLLLLLLLVSQTSSSVAVFHRSTVGRSSSRIPQYLRRILVGNRRPVILHRYSGLRSELGFESRSTGMHVSRAGIVVDDELAIGQVETRGERNR